MSQSPCDSFKEAGPQSMASSWGQHSILAIFFASYSTEDCRLFSLFTALPLASLYWSVIPTLYFAAL